MQTAYGYAIRNNKGDQASSVAAIWAMYRHMIKSPSEESVESHKYHKNKIFNTKTYDRSKFLHDCHHQISKMHVNVASLNIKMSPLAT